VRFFQRRPETDQRVGAPVRSDRVLLAAGAAQNLVGIAIAGIALFAAQVLMSRALGPAGYGTVTVLTQAAFVLSFATRAGMDMAVLREVAIDIGAGRPGRTRGAVARAAWIALAVSLAAAALILLARGSLQDLTSLSRSTGSWAVPAAALGIPFIALANVWLNATRGLKIMRYTLYIYWAGQNLAWIVLSLILWQLAVTPDASIAAYSLSWALAALASAWAWRREATGWQVQPVERGWLRRLMKYAGPRAPAALFAQLLFWADLFVVANYVTDEEVGVYSASLRAGQVLLLFLTSVNLVFAPFVADLNARGEGERLAELFKSLTRWIVAGTLPLLLLILVAPAEILTLFGGGFEQGREALVIVLIGQFVNSAAGGGGLVLIMIGRTGYDLIVYAGSLVLSLALAFLLCPALGITGAAIANAVTFTVSNVARLILVWRFTGMHPYDIRFGRLIAPTVVSLVTMWSTHNLVDGSPFVRLITTAAAGMLVYGVAYCLWGLTDDERAGLSDLVRRRRA
jgi:O-antigen/teichoic acid export membrane protein